MIHRIGKRVLTLDKGRLVSDHQLLGSAPPRLALPTEPEPEEPVS
jgi:hypothetical protein